MNKIRQSILDLFSKILRANRKAWLIRNYIHILILGSLGIYLILFPVVYTNYFLHVGKPTFSRLSTRLVSNMNYGIDQLNIVSYQGEKVYALDGWAFPQDDSLPLESYRKQVALINPDSTYFLFDAETTERKDVTKYFSGLNRNLDHSGFRAYISEYALQIGIYQIGILYTTPEGKLFYRPTQRYIERSPNWLRFIDNRTEKPTMTTSTLNTGLEIFSTEPALIESKMYYGVDQLILYSDSSTGVYALDGWAFPLNVRTAMDSYKKQIVLIGSNSTAHFYYAETTERRDVTKFFSNQNRNLDHSGFRGYISASTLRLGYYRVGILYTGPNSEIEFCLTYKYIERTSDALRLLNNAPGGS